MSEVCWIIDCNNVGCLVTAVTVVNLLFSHFERLVVVSRLLSVLEQSACGVIMKPLVK